VAKYRKVTDGGHLSTAHSALCFYNSIASYKKQHLQVSKY